MQHRYTLLRLKYRIAWITGLHSPPQVGSRGAFNKCIFWLRFFFIAKNGQKSLIFPPKMTLKSRVQKDVPKVSRVFTF